MLGIMIYAIIGFIVGLFVTICGISEYEGYNRINYILIQIPYGIIAWPIVIVMCIHYIKEQTKEDKETVDEFEQKLKEAIKESTQ